MVISVYGAYPANLHENRNVRLAFTLIAALGASVCSCKRNDQPQPPTAAKLPTMSISAASPGDGSSPSRPRAAGVGQQLSKIRAAYHQGRNEIDLNGDGTPEWFLTRDPDGKAIGERIDFGNDNIPEVIVTRTTDRLTVSKDRDGDGVFERVFDVHFNVDETNGMHVEDSSNRASSRLPNWRVTYDLRLHSDVIDFEHWQMKSTPDHFEKIMTTHADRSQSSVTIASGSGSNACPSSVQDALHRAESDGAECLSTMSTDLAMDYVRVLVEGKIQITCTQENGPGKPHAFVDAYQAYACLNHPDSCEATVHLVNVGALTDMQLAGLIFHELLHTAGFLHLLGDGDKDPLDQVYACQRECFAKGGQDNLPSDVSACIGTACPAGSTLCGGQCEPSMCEDGQSFNNSTCKCALDCSQASYCPCNDPSKGKPRLYPSELECAAQCPSGLRCFTSLCTRPPGCGN